MLHIFLSTPASALPLRAVLLILAVVAVDLVAIVVEVIGVFGVWGGDARVVAVPPPPPLGCRAMRQKPQIRCASPVRRWKGDSIRYRVDRMRQAYGDQA